MTHALYYPPANRTAQWFATKYPGAVFTSLEKLLLHTTEGPGWPAYQGGAVAPNLTVYPDTANHRLTWRQHWPVNQSSRALRHTRTQPTNGDHVVQIEMIGTCVPGGPGLYWPGAPDWALAGIADFLAWLASEWGSHLLSSTVNWRAYNASGDSQRLSDSAYNAYRGMLGHEHAPQNDHRDPGALNAARIIQLAGGTMALTDDDIARLTSSSLFINAIRTAVWKAGWGGSRETEDLGGNGRTEHADFRLYWASHQENGASATADAVLASLPDALREAFAQVAPTLAEAIVEHLPSDVTGLTTADVREAVREVLKTGADATD